MNIGQRGSVAKLAEHLIIELGDPDTAPTRDEIKEARNVAKRIADIVKRHFFQTSRKRRPCLLSATQTSSGRSSAWSSFPSPISYSAIYTDYHINRG